MLDKEYMYNPYAQDGNEAEWRIPLKLTGDPTFKNFRCLKIFHKEYCL